MKYRVYPRTNCCSVTKVLMLPDDKEEEDNVAVPKKATDDRRSMFSWAKQYHRPSAILCSTRHHPGNDKRVSEQASKQERLNEANCLLPTWQTMAPENAGSPGIFLLAMPSSISFLARSDFLPLWLVFPRLILIGKRASMAGKFLLVTYNNYYYCCTGNLLAL